MCKTEAYKTPDYVLAADEYIGHPYELGEDICTTRLRNAFADGARWKGKQVEEKGYLPPEMVQDLLDMQAKHAKEDMMEKVVEGTLEGQLLKNLTEDGKRMVISVPRSVFKNKPKSRIVKLIIIEEE